MRQPSADRDFETRRAARAAADATMTRLYRRCRGQLTQPLVTDFSIADIFLEEVAGGERAMRPIQRAAYGLWSVTRRLLGPRSATAINMLFWSLASVPPLLIGCTRLHEDAFAFEGDPSAPVHLFRTGVANEPIIATWLSRRHREPVVMVSYDPAPQPRLGALRHLGGLVATHIGVVREFAVTIRAVLREGVVTTERFDLIAPQWMVILARRSFLLSQFLIAARLVLAPKRPRLVYFTMNYLYENALLHLLPEADAGYVQHGFPRRDFPPLPCRQLVYTEGLARYLRQFDPGASVEIIGHAYFPKGRIEPQRTIVLASLQDWPQFGVTAVRETMVRALNAARDNGWRVVFRARDYDTDAFAQTLDFPWDETSTPARETFDTCLERVGPAMVWTTWSTAVVDAHARRIAGVCFITRTLELDFITDLDQFAHVVYPDGTGWDDLVAALASPERSGLLPTPALQRTDRHLPTN